MNKFKKPVKPAMASSFWLNDEFLDRVQENGKDLIQLSGYRRAVSNFVRIVTGENIPVRFSTGQDSYTNGKEVTISASADPSKFDVNVGLALHEGSHCKLTDFKLFTVDYAARAMAALFGEVIDVNNLPVWATNEMYRRLSYNGHPDPVDASDTQKFEALSNLCSYGELGRQLKDVFNIVEDRRIDYFVYTTAPGYKAYYQALYDKYFNLPIIDKGLRSKEYRTEEWDAYMFRLINITNPNRDLTALKGLQDIWNVFDLANVGRMKNSEDAFMVACQIFSIIYSNITQPFLNGDDVDKDALDKAIQDQKDMSKAEAGNGDPDNFDMPNTDPMQGQGTGEKSPDSDDTDDTDGDAEGGDPMSSTEEGTGGSGSSNGQDDTNELGNKGLEELSMRDRERLMKSIKEQKKIVDGEMKKTKMSKKDAAAVNSVDEAGADLHEVQFNDYDWHGNAKKQSTKVLVIRNFSPKIAEDLECGMWSEPNIRWGGKDRIASVEEGIRLGHMLGRRLKVRNEDRSTKFNRLNAGKIDKRMIASAGYGMENIFEKLETFSYKPSIIHISIDASGSMSGGRMRKAVVTATAIAKACSMIENMDCVISFRSGTYMNSNSYPTIVYAYDSRKHSVTQLRSHMPWFIATGSTPEGLCFDAIMKDLVNSSRGKDAYFINFSDGEPCYDGYHGKGAADHTATQVRKMQYEGIKVLSYFISEYIREDSNSCKMFKTMYGKDAAFVNVESIFEVAKTMNNKFLEVV